MTRNLQELLAGSTGDPLWMAGSLGVAFFLGAAHALTPGHGKALVAAYLVGSKGRISDAIYLGGVVTITHTASVFALGLITLYASHRVSLDRIFPALSLISGLLVACVGAWLLFTRTSGQGHHHHHHHDHPHDHGHDHDNEHGHHHHHHHDEGAGRGSLLSLGISGGLVPCPEALVVLMLSISVGKVLLGLALLTAFTLGLAAVLMAIGCAMVMAGPAMQRWSGESGWIKKLPVVSAAIVTVVGVAMVVEAVGRI